MVAYNLLYRTEQGQRRAVWKTEACFSRMEGYGGQISWYENGENKTITRDKNVVISRVRYYPTHSKLVSKDQLDRFFTELREAMPELPWGPFDFAHWKRHGISVDATKFAGQVIVGLFSIIRYADEYPSAITRYFLLRDKVWLDVLPAFFMMHQFTEYDPQGKEWRYVSSCGGGHSALSGKLMYEPCYKHFVHKKWVEEMKKLPPYSTVWRYNGVQQLFGRSNDSYQTKFLQENKAPAILMYGDSVPSPTDSLVQIANKWKKE